MKITRFLHFVPMPTGWLTILGLIFLTVSCAPKVTFKVIKPPELPIDNISMVSIGEFNDEHDKKVPLPKGLKPVKSSKSLVRSFESNTDAAQLVRAYVVSSLSEYGDYQILNTTSESYGISGVQPDETKIGEVRAKVRFYEYNHYSNDQVFFVLMATNNNVSIQQKIIIGALKSVAVSAAERNKKGFKIPVAYIEKIGAIEVEFDFVRKSDGSKIIPTQTLTYYYTEKWGGNEELSIMTPQIWTAINTGYMKKKGILDELGDVADQGILLFQDPEEFKSKGYLLKQNKNVPLLSLDVRMLLAKKVAGDFVRKISRYHEFVDLKIAGGDSIAQNLIRANAYEKAINRLENQPKPLPSDDLYNLALAYEAIGEFNQALKYYATGLDTHGGSEFKDGIDRTDRR